jgi:hypothetical protein
MSGDMPGKLVEIITEPDCTKLIMKDGQRFLYWRKLKQKDSVLRNHLKVGTKYQIWVDGLTEVISSIKELKKSF